MILFIFEFNRALLRLNNMSYLAFLLGRSVLLAFGAGPQIIQQLIILLVIPWTCLFREGFFDHP
jgi:hypothetical protein